MINATHKGTKVKFSTGCIFEFYYTQVLKLINIRILVDLNLVPS
eukprot:COSAG01_NODE_63115_length_281_cov_0.851648_1_plen_43_part_10